MLDAPETPSLAPRARTRWTWEAIQHSCSSTLALIRIFVRWIRGAPRDTELDVRVPAAPHLTAAIHDGIAAVCPSCSGPLIQNVLDGLCPRCIFEGLLEDPPGAEGLPWTKIGEWELIDQLGEGGMGVVYLVRHVHDGIDAAMKFPKPEALLCEEGLVQFYGEIANTKKLRHRNITRVYESGTHDGRPYYVMELLDGGTLEDASNREKYRAPKPAVELMVKMARAVEFAHAHGVLHCDIKPSNVLFDWQGEPHVSDFGLAQGIEQYGIARGEQQHNGALGGQAHELVAGSLDDPLLDVFQLGVMLHWLLKGGPREGAREATVRGPTWVPTLEWALEAICHRALQADRQRGYASVADVASDLELASKGLPIEEEHGRSRRTIRWINRHRVISLLGLELALLLVCMPLVVAQMLSELRPTLRELIRFSAKAQAGSVLNELREAFSHAQNMASDPEVRALVTWHGLETPPAALSRHKGKFDNVFVFDQAGFFQARSLQPKRFDRRPDYAFRDYFQCAKQLTSLSPEPASNAACIGRAYRSTTDCHLKLGIAAPLRDAQHAFIGVVQASIDARASFGGIQMNGCEGKCISALIGPRDRDEPEAPLPDTLAMLAHPALKPPPQSKAECERERFQEPRISASIARQICGELDCSPDLRDPLGGAQKDVIVIDEFADPVTHQASLAALAPVGKTGLIVAVAVPNTALDGIIESIGRKAGLLVALVLSLGVSAVGAVLAAPHVLRLYRQRRAGSRKASNA